MLFVRKTFLSRTLAETLNTKPKLCASYVTENYFVYTPKVIAGNDGTHELVTIGAPLSSVAK